MNDIYTKTSLGGQTDFLSIFRDWMDAAEQSEPNDPNAVALATSSLDGHPSVRMVLMKHADQHGFTFFTNEQSQKGVELTANPRAAMCFHWKALRRQVRVEGVIVRQSAEEVDTYFHSRSRRSQLGAAASQQSRPLGSRKELENAVAELDHRFPGEIPRPPYWVGYVLEPERIEFWQDGPDRLHDRIAFTRSANTWISQRLYP